MSGIECRLNFENRPVRSRDIKGGPKRPPLATNRGSQEPATNRVKSYFSITSVWPLGAFHPFSIFVHRVAHHSNYCGTKPERAPGELCAIAGATCLGFLFWQLFCNAKYTRIPYKTRILRFKKRTYIRNHLLIDYAPLTNLRLMHPNLPSPSF